MSKLFNTIPGGRDGSGGLRDFARQLREIPGRQVTNESTALGHMITVLISDWRIGPGWSRSPPRTQPALSPGKRTSPSLTM